VGILEGEGSGGAILPRLGAEVIVEAGAGGHGLGVEVGREGAILFQKVTEASQRNSKSQIPVAKLFTLPQIIFRYDLTRGNQLQASADSGMHKVADAHARKQRSQAAGGISSKLCLSSAQAKFSRRRREQLIRQALHEIALSCKPLLHTTSRSRHSGSGHPRLTLCVLSMKPDSCSPQVMFSAKLRHQLNCQILQPQGEENAREMITDARTRVHLIILKPPSISSYQLGEHFVFSVNSRLLFFSSSFWKRTHFPGCLCAADKCMGGA
jgi:hypothetical protein